MKKSTTSFLGGCLATLVVVAAASFLYHGCQSKKNPEVQTETTTDIKTDTIPRFIDNPVLKDSIVLRYQTVKVPVSDTIRNTLITDTLRTDSVSVQIPITQKVYEDSTYRAWVSGYMPALDSIQIYQPVKTITHTVTNTQIQYRTKRWGLGVQAGIGITPNKVEPYIGVGVTYNIFAW